MSVQKGSINFSCSSLLYKNRHKVNLQVHVVIGTVKPVHAVSFIKQSPLSKGQPFLSCQKIFIWIEPLLRGHLSYKAIFFICLRGDLILQGRLCTLICSLLRCDLETELVEKSEIYAREIFDKMITASIWNLIYSKKYSS